VYFVGSYYTRSREYQFYCPLSCDDVLFHREMANVLDWPAASYYCNESSGKSICRKVGTVPTYRFTNRFCQHTLTLLLLMCIGPCIIVIVEE